MSAHLIFLDIMLAIIVIVCWLGVIGMWRMPEPTQALHYIALPTTIGIISLTIAVLVTRGFNQDFFKMLLICATLLAFNSVTTHATARAFRARKLGHWQPRDGDPMEFVRDSQESS